MGERNQYSFESSTETLDVLKLSEVVKKMSADYEFNRNIRCIEIELRPQDCRERPGSTETLDVLKF